jgi:glycosyltransferase involved in cell wall biosynthesis
VVFVSVIVANYNYARTLGLCLHALREQTYPEMEIIFVDDRSTDNSVEVAERAGVAVHSTPVNSGVSVARNLGADRAKGDVLFFVDSDIALAPDAVANVVAALRAAPQVGVVCGTYEPEPLIRDSLVEEYRNLHQHYWISAAAGPISGWVFAGILAIRADVFHSVGGFSERLRGSEGADIGGRLTGVCEMRIDTSIRGRHDNDDRLSVVLRKVFLRSQTLFSFFVRWDRLGHVSHSPQARGGLYAMLALAAAPLPALLDRWWTLAVPVLPLILAVRADADLYRYVRRLRGTAFTLFFIGTHVLVNLAGMVGAALGAVQWLSSRRFRHLYDTPEPATREANR